MPVKMGLNKNENKGVKPVKIYTRNIECRKDRHIIDEIPSTTMEATMPKTSKPRNFHACHPIMRKGGAHEKSKSGKRSAAKRETRRKASEWLGRPAFISQ